MSNKRAWCVVLLVILASACGGANSVSTLPSPLPQTGATPSLGTVSGMVLELTNESKWVPVQGVFVTGPWDYPVTTDSNGFFSLSACGDSPCVFHDGDRFNAYLSKDGYQPATIEVTVDGNTQLEIALVRL